MTASNLSLACLNVEPKQGAGNTIDDNTASRAFGNEGKFAVICGVDVNLIHKLHIILIAMSAKLPLDADNFGTFYRDTVKLLVNLYHMMPVSMHVLLIHGDSIVSLSILPIGLMSEEAQ